jgi:drug/metabolite transporter (DMT)-like permease
LFVDPKFPVLAVIVLLVAIGLGVVAQFFMKIGLNTIEKKLGKRPGPTMVLKSIFTPWVFSAFVLYFLSSMLYLQALSRLPLSYAYPMIALSYVAVVGGSYWVLGERLNPIRIAGLVTIIAGVVLVALSYGSNSSS